MLFRSLKECGFVDPWRELHTGTRQYTWVKVSERRVSAARLDRFYITKTDRHRVLNAFMAPSGFSDHHAVVLDVLLARKTKSRSYWRFNVKLIQDEMFCRNFTTFWEGWRMRKADFDNVSLWWEVGKTQIKSFCQLYSAHTASVVRSTVWGLEREINLIENELVKKYDAEVSTLLEGKRKALGSYLYEQAKGALTRARVCSIKDMDAPTAFFFNLERKGTHQNPMQFLQHPEGHLTSVPAEMRKIAVDFYTDLYSADVTSFDCRDELLEGLPKLGTSHVEAMDSDIQFHELTSAVQQLTTGRSPGIDGLPAEFYKSFWNIIGMDLFEVFKWSRQAGQLPLSCTRAVLSLRRAVGDF